MNTTTPDLATSAIEDRDALYKSLVKLLRLVDKRCGGRIEGTSQLAIAANESRALIRSMTDEEV